MTRRQLEDEQPVRRIMVDTGKSSAERRLVAMRQELDSLLLRYHERHPDVVSVQSQIADLEKRVATQTDDDRDGGVTEVMENPVYENLKIQLSDGTTRLTVQKNRLASLERLLEDAFERSQRVAENQAQLSELTRDYNVTRGVYEDMLRSGRGRKLQSPGASILPHAVGWPAALSVWPRRPLPGQRHGAGPAGYADYV